MQKMSKIKGSQNQADSTNRDDDSSTVDTEKQTNSTTQLVIVNPLKSPISSITSLVNIVRPFGRRITADLPTERNNIQSFTSAETHPSQGNNPSTAGQVADNNHVEEPQQNIPQLVAATENKSSEVQLEVYSMIIDDSVVVKDKAINERKHFPMNLNKTGYVIFSVSYCMFTSLSLYLSMYMFECVHLCECIFVCALCIYMFMCLCV